MFSKKLPLKKTGFLFLVVIIAGLFLTNINSTEAVAWKTITDLPGLPAGSEVSLSDFIIVLYDFLLSAVGIAAMFMIIIGGFRYLTAAGNAASMAEAKDIIYSALYGLILALSTWIIVSTINPDLLYLKKPGTKVNPVDYSCISSSLSCNTDAAKDGCNAGSLVDPDCNLPGATCASGDGCVFGPCDPPDPDCNYTTANCCYGVCDAASSGKCPEKPISCINPASPLSGYNDGGVLKCKCINGHTINKGAAVDCDDACFNDYGWGMPSCVRFRVLVGFKPDENYFSFKVNPEQQYSISIGEKLYYKIVIDDPRGIMASAPINSMDCDSDGIPESAFCFKLNCDLSNDAGDPTAVPPIPPKINEWEIATNSFSGMTGQGLNNRSFSYTYTNPLPAITNTAHYVASWNDPKCPMGLCYDSKDFWFKVEN